PARSRCRPAPGGGLCPSPRGRTDPPMLPVALALALAAAPPARTSVAAERVITADSIRAHVRFLASDLLEGRGPGTRGDTLAETYIAAQLEALGLKPAGTQGFLQPFDIVGVQGHADSVQFTRGRESLVLRNADEVVAAAGDRGPLRPPDPGAWCCWWARASAPRGTRGTPKGNGPPAEGARSPKTRPRGPPPPSPRAAPASGTAAGITSTRWRRRSEPPAP